jgi:hypothetical protein
MRSSSICARFEVVALALALGACGSPSNGASADCSVTLTGNTTEGSDVGACAKLVQSGGADWLLSIDTSTATLARLNVFIDLGAAPVPGIVTAEGQTATWNVVGVASASSCMFQAGNGAAPEGNFTLDVTDVDTTSAIIHGTLDVDAYVHAPPTTDCGYEDLEHLTIRF